MNHVFDLIYPTLVKMMTYFTPSNSFYHPIHFSINEAMNLTNIKMTHFSLKNLVIVIIISKYGGDPFCPNLILILPISGDPFPPSGNLLIKFEVTHFTLWSDSFYPLPCKTAICIFHWNTGLFSPSINIWPISLHT